MDKPSDGFVDENEIAATDQDWEDFEKFLRKKKKEEKKKPEPQMAFYPFPLQEEEYQSTLMYGRYSRQLGEFAKLEGLKAQEKRRIKEEKQRKRELRGYQGKLAKTVSFLWKHTFARLGEDWVFLALLGIIMALISFIMDHGISMCNSARIWLFNDLSYHPAAQYAAWVSLPVTLVLFSAGFVHLVAPQSIGSGIPEMKTILRGVALKEYLTFKTLVAKVIGLTATLGSGMPLGKEGPFVHIASITATLLSKLITGFQGIYENESRTTEMLAAACAVGVGSCFAAPVGGVLFSIEVTTTYFAVRNYWRGFFAAVCGATTFRLLAVWFQRADTVTAVFRTNFLMDFPFDPQELFVFALIGAFCGLTGAFYVWVHRQYVMFMRNSKTINSFLQKNRFLYPSIVALAVSTLTFPLGSGQFIAGDLNTHDQVSALFSNFTWTKMNHTPYEESVIKHWKTDYTGVIFSLNCYVIFVFVASIICSTIPIPAGSFIPVFKIGAGIGRIVGELMHMWFPTGMRYGGNVAQIIPGGYATVGAAAFAGSVTHTISVAVIVFEMTGQVTHIVPIMIAVLISNAVASLLAPSLYDSIILIKKLPYLPDLLPSSSGMYNVYVEDFMIRDIKYIFHGMTYEELKLLLKENRRLQSFPLVDKPESMILLGSIQRLQLIQTIEKHIGRDRRLQVVAIRQREAAEKAAEEARKQAEERKRRPSRFQVVPAPDMLERHTSENHLEPHQHTYTPNFGTQPKKSILKKTNSFTLKGFSPFMNTSPGSTPYTTVTGAESRIRSAFEAIFRKSAHLQDVDNSEGQHVLDSPRAVQPQIVPVSPTTSKKVQLPKERVCDMSPEDQRKWEDEQMRQPVDFTACQIDPAPFQLVERTSLLKVHSLFSMVGVNHAYVTAIGKLVGVVGLKELRKAIEDANSGNLPQHADANPGSGSVSVCDVKEPLDDVDSSVQLVSKV
ncbi:chloride channel protein 2 [Anthonomus grandis grandis]|uniref:chloride channel protein 2 n=1 Tax=Anthonomus grandis grandis TaxID=2921223 RepID=UPI0021668F99|nr:chloride channel protein 2 [Anthonomus grandis grandis]